MSSAKLLFLILVSLLASELNSSILPSSKQNDVLFKKNARPREKLPKNFPQRNATVEPPLLIGSFNIQTLGKKKFNNFDVMDIVKKVILRYDVIFVTELMDDRYISKLLMDINGLAENSEIYNVTLSEKKNETQEQYAYFYRASKLKVIKQESYNDPENFYRKPFIVIFEAFTLRDMQKFGAIGHHVKPSNAVGEINALADAYDYVTRKYGTKDVILMGDFNADCAYVKEKDWDDISLWTRSEFTWAITGNMDTTTNYRSCTLDRFVYAGENMNNGIILSSAGVFNFQQEYELSVSQTRNVSDHFPIELKIRGKMSDIAEKHLIADLCFTVRDARKIPKVTDQDLANASEKSAFEATRTADGALFSKRAVEEEDMLTALKRLRSALPGVVTRELEDAAAYKVRHGSLEDESSFADIFESGYKINVLAAAEFAEVTICRKTSVN